MMRHSDSTQFHRSASVPYNIAHLAAQDLKSEESSRYVRGMHKSRSMGELKKPSLMRMFSTTMTESDIGRTITNSSFGKTVQRHQTQIPVWMCCSVFILCFYHMCSDGDYSFLLTVGSVIGTVSFSVLLLKIISSQNMSGISLQMMICYAVLTASRLCSILFYESYLPFDRSGDIVYRVAEVLNCIAASYIVYLGTSGSKYSRTVNHDSDIVKSYWLAIPSFLLAVLFHPNLNGFAPSDIAWTFGLNLESVAVLPQLFLFNQQKKVEPATTHFLAAQSLSRLMTFMFWWWSWQELNDASHPLRAYVGLWVLITQLAQLLVLCDFIYSYVMTIIRGGNFQDMLIPTTIV
eukprot:GHVL01014645.1.p1 GENE.GHVL01014645.1~~GHVL01014645.1.p1  ORF type:complete len:348 (+),score=32.88 GHVL01014645.1:132-1175(+)